MFPLTDAERTDARRFCGYSAYGIGPGDASFQRYNVSYELLEWRMANLSDAELVVTRSKLAELNTLDTAIAGASANLDTDQAAVWTRNRSEVRDRNALFLLRSRALCAFLGVPPGPGLASGGGSIALLV